MSTTDIPRANPKGLLSSLPLTIAYLRDPIGVMRDVQARHGDVVRMNLFGMEAVVLLGAEANARVLLNQDQTFSSSAGWAPLLGAAFPNGLISMDGVTHHADRRLIAAAFKPAALKAHMVVMNAAIRDEIGRWAGSLRFYPHIKRFTLGLAAKVFLGLPMGREADQVSRWFTQMLGASTAMTRAPIPGGAVWRGARARQRLSRWLLARIRTRRGGGGGGSDLLTALCDAIDEDGRGLPDEAIADHMSLLWMAAHDTTASALTFVVIQLGRRPEWQDRLREELHGALGASEAPLDPEALRRLPITNAFIDESLRLTPPVPSLPRGVTQPFTFGGFAIGAGATVGVHLLHTHRSAQYWTRPDDFAPERFLPGGEAQAPDRPRHVFVPFGGGVHTCLGLHFAYMQIKLILLHLLDAYRIELSDDRAQTIRWLPIAHPADGAPIRLSPR